MSHDETQIILEQLQGVTDAGEALRLHNRLVEVNLRLVYTIVNAMRRTSRVRYLGVEDAEQTGFLALIRASRTFTPGKGVSFSQYAGVCIRRELLNKVRGNDAFWFKIPTGQFSDSFPKDYHLKSEGRFQDPSLAITGEQSDVEHILSHLNAEQKLMVQLLAQDHGIRKVARTLGHSADWVRSQLKLIRRRLEKKNLLPGSS